MAKINLLPWRETRREQLKQEFLANLGVAVVGAAVLLGLFYLLLSNAMESQEQRNNYIQKHISDLNDQLEEITDLKARKAQLEDRMGIIQGLQGNRPVIVRIFDQFVRTLPDGVYYRHLSRQSTVIQIEGTAESNNRVSSLMRNLDGSDWFTSPNLTSVTSNPEFGEQANNFNLTVALGTPATNSEAE